MHVARDDQRMASLREQLRFFAPNIDVLQFPAWDTVPYDRVSPNAELSSRRIATLAQLAAAEDAQAPDHRDHHGQCRPAARAAARGMRKALVKLTAGMTVDMSQHRPPPGALGLPALPAR